MNRSTIVYILMIGVFAVGLWAILGAGTSRLTAREDLAGDWELTPLPGTAGDVQAMHVDQSGRFFNLGLPNRPTLRMKMVEESHGKANHGRQKLIRLTGSDGQFTFTGVSRSDHWRLTAVGTVQGDWEGRLVNRMYPRARTATRSSP